MEKVKVTQPTDQDQRQFLQLSSAEITPGLKNLLTTKNNLFKNKTNTSYAIYLKT